MNRFKLNKLTQIIELSGVIAYPTESVFGLGCNPLDYFAVKKILSIKLRPEHKGLIILAASISQLRPWVENIPQNIWHQIENSFATNWVLPKSNLVPKWISGSHESIAIRLSSHPTVCEICNALDYPIVSTSANISNRPALSDVIKIRKNFINKVDLIVNETAGGLPPCKIINPFSNQTIRS